MEKIIESMHRLRAVKLKSRNKESLEKQFTLKYKTNKKYEREIKHKNKDN